MSGRVSANLRKKKKNETTPKTFEPNVFCQSWRYEECGYPFFAITPRSTLTRSGSTGSGSSVGQIDLYENRSN